MDMEHLISHVRDTGTKKFYTGNMGTRYKFDKRGLNPFCGLETGKGIFYNHENLYSDEIVDELTDTANYYINLIKLVDRALIHNNLHELSVEQQELLEQYFNEAVPLTRAHYSAKLQDYFDNGTKTFLQDIWIKEETDTDRYLKLKFNEKYYDLDNNLTRYIQRLDHFLGSYFGEDNGEFLSLYRAWTSRRQKQLHC